MCILYIVRYRYHSVHCSDGKNVYTCFRCDFTLCVCCVKGVGGEGALATVASASSDFDQVRVRDELHTIFRY